jgi:hypothetical protein
MDPAQAVIQHHLLYNLRRRRQQAQYLRLYQTTVLRIPVLVMLFRIRESTERKRSTSWR